jgi:hypothetical protein
MNLKQITLITTIGIAMAFAIFLINFLPWGHIRITSFIGNALMYSSLLFFLINLYRRG